ncbi:UNVERIFIED_CONTAM: putative amino acid permease 7 [Sesamum latifolium]|uniref:Amino acid permease 7 n=1 Tax=Sesamum latifolium TaxID=2727402 RepID=A0AAW2TPZ5_9LAMI
MPAQLTRYNNYFTLNKAHGRHYFVLSGPSSESVWQLKLLEKQISGEVETVQWSFLAATNSRQRSSMVEVEEKDEHSYPLLTDVASSSTDSHASLKRTGTVWTAIAHIITGVIGYPHPEVGHIRNRSYAEAVSSYLGKKSMWVAGIFLQESYYGYGIAYTITSAISMRAILKSNCYHKEGHDAPCEYGDSLFILLFGAVQVVFSDTRLPQHGVALNICCYYVLRLYVHRAGSWFCKSSRQLLANAGDGQIRGDFGGVPTTTVAQKVWLSSQAIGDIAFAFTYNIILLDIEDTLKAPPPENKTMKKASTVAILITSFFFLCCGCFGYAAFGNEAPGNLLTDFGFYEPYWLVDIANACIVLHLVGGYQIYSQPLFAVAERQIAKKHPNSRFVNDEYIVKLPLLPRFKLNLLRLCFRTVYVASTTGLALVFPYFNQVLGVLGALNFWPLAIYFPVQMYLVQNNVRAWTGQWIALQAFRVFCLLCTILAFIGSLEGLISSKLS